MRGTRQGRTVELRLEGRWLRLWGLLGREVSLDTGELPSLPDRTGILALRPLGSGPWATCISLPCAGAAAGQKAWHHKATRICDRGMDEMRAL